MLSNEHARKAKERQKLKTRSLLYYMQYFALKKLSFTSSMSVLAGLAGLSGSTVWENPAKFSQAETYLLLLYIIPTPGTHVWE